MADIIFSEVEYNSTDDSVTFIFWEENEYDWAKCTVEIPFSSVCWKTTPNVVYKNHAINWYKDCVHFLIEVGGKPVIVKYTSQDLVNDIYEMTTAPPFPY